MSDPIVDEVRKARDEYARRFNYDLEAMCADLRRQQATSEAPIVSFPRKPVRITTHRRAQHSVETAADVEADA